MADADDVVAALVLTEHGGHVLGDLVHLLAGGEGHAGDLAGVGLGGGLGGVQAEHADLGAAGGGEHGCVVKGQLAVVLHIGGQHGEAGGLHVLLQRFEAVVELVVAQSRGVVARHVHQLDGGGALRQAHIGGALAEVAGVQDQDVGALGLVLAGQHGHLGVVLDGAVDVVGVEDDHGLGGGGILAGGGLLFTAGGQGDDHGDGQQQRQQFLLHTPYSFLAAYFPHGACVCCMHIVPDKPVICKAFLVKVLFTRILHEGDFSLYMACLQ